MRGAGRAFLATLSLVVLIGCQAATPSPSPSAAPSASAEVPATASLPPAPTPTALATATPHATVPPTDAPTEAPTPTLAPTDAPTASPTATATADPAAWIGPTRVSSRDYADISLVVDGGGIVHAAASLGRSIWYVTNGSGSWTRDEVTSPPSGRADRNPSIAIDGAGNLAVAFQRLGSSTPFGRLPEGIYVSAGGPGSWSVASEPDGRLDREPSLAAAPDGSFVLAAGQDFPIDVIEDGQEFPVLFLTGLPGSPAAQRIHRIGTDPVVRMAPDGLARVLLGDQLQTLGERPLRYAVAGSASGDFALEDIPGTSGYDWPFSLAIDGSGIAHAVWHDEDAGGLYYARRDGSGWTAPQLVSPGAVGSAVGIAVDASGGVHIVDAMYTSGVSYFTNRSGAFMEVPLHDGTGIFADIGVDASGRAHMLFVLGNDDFEATELWYAAAPGL